MYPVFVDTLWETEQVLHFIMKQPFALQLILWVIIFMMYLQMAWVQWIVKQRP